MGLRSVFGTAASSRPAVSLVINRNKVVASDI